MKTPFIRTALARVLIAASLASGMAGAAAGGLSVSYYGHYGHGYGHHGYYRYSRPYYGYGYSRPHYYGYRYSRPYYGRNRYDYDYRQSGSSQQSPAGDDYADTTAPDTQSSGQASAWDLLGEGRQAAALSRFADAAQRQPGAALPKLGYALAASANGNHERAVWAMRRAFAVDPQALHYAQLSDSNRALIDTLAQRYSDADDPAINTRDSAFMAAALHYIRRDNAAAALHLQLARENGDDSAGASKLEQVLHE